MCEGPSKISGPIPPDPTLFPNYYKRPGTARSLEGSALKASLEPPWQGAPLDQPAPQTRLASQQGLMGVLLQFQEVSLGREPLPKRKDSKDHEKENVRRIRQIQKRFQEQERAQDHSRPQPFKALWRSPKYDKVESRLKVKLQEPSAAASGPELPAFLRAYSRCGPGVQPRRVASAGLALASTDGSQPPGTEAKGQAPAVDFITHNARTAKVAPRRRSRSVQCLAEVQEQQRRAQEDYNTKQKGQVPLYLVERKDLWRREAEERQQNQPDPEIPPGHTMMPESQRLDTLNSLLQSQQELLRELVLLPSRADSLRAQNHKAELEKKLSQVEEALKIFSRSKVFIKMDS